MKYMLLLNRTADALPESGTPDLDEALKWAAIIPAARDASVEVRPIVATQAPV